MQAARSPRASQPELQSHRVDVPAAELGITRPPASVQAWWIDHRPLRLYVVTAAGRAPAVRSWIARDGLDVEIEEGLAPRTLWARHRSLPKGWSPVLQDPTLRRIEVHPSGCATLVLEGKSDHVQAVLARLRDDAPGMVERPVLDPWRDLTMRQREALAQAVAMGHYEVPRRASLRDVAKALDLSPATTSELLRRGERVLVASHFDRTGLKGRAPPLWVPRRDDARPLLGAERVRLSPV